MTETRTNSVILVVGARGTGKTRLLKELMRLSKKRKKYLIDTADNDVWKNMGTFDRPANSAIKIPILQIEDLYKQPEGLHRIITPDPEELYPELQRTTRNSLIVLEDATRYVESRISKPLKRIVLDTKQKNNDLILVFHALAEVPPKLVRMSDKIVLFKTQESYNASKYPFPIIEYWMKKIAENKSRYFYKTIPLS